MVVAEWDVTAMLLDGSELSGMMPTLLAENPAAAEVAFHADPVNGRRDVDRLNRSLFQAEVVDGEEAIQICRKPRAGEAVYVFKQANIEALQNPPRTSAQAEPQPSGSGTTHLQSGAPRVLSLPVPVLNLRRKSPGLKPPLTKIRVYALKVKFL
jgi:hypothetical protein